MIKNRRNLIIKTIILFLLSVFALLSFTFVSDFFHEEAHVLAGRKYNICLNNKANYIEHLSTINLGPFVSASANFCSIDDCQKYLQLNDESKREVDLAGIRSDLNFLNILLSIWPSCLLILALFFKYKEIEKRLIIFIIFICINLILIGWMTWLITNTNLNLFQPGGDLSRLLLKGWRCS
jgi:hypothetical protein